jgi:hypothetical protein
MIATDTLSLADAVQMIGDTHDRSLGRHNRLPGLFSVLVESGGDDPTATAIEAIQLTMPVATVLDLKGMDAMQIGNALGQRNPGILVVDYNDPAFTPTQKALFLQILLDARYGNATFSLNTSNTLVIVQTNDRGKMLPWTILNKTTVLGVSL